MTTQTLAQQAQQGNTNLALGQADIMEMFGDSKLDTSTALSFNIVKILRESALFELGKDEMVKTLTGHILFKHAANQWWEIPFDQRTPETSPVPNCYSIDGITQSGGDKPQCALCCNCEQNKFGTGKDEQGKACRNTVRFLFLVDGSVLPVVIIAPPTSLSKKGSLQQWLNNVPNQVAKAYNDLGIKTKNGGSIVDYWPARVELTLAKQKFNSGMEASVLQIKTLEVITPNTQDGAAKLKSLFTVVNQAKEAYQKEQQAYMESGAESEHVAESGEDAGNDDDIPV